MLLHASVVKYRLRRRKPCNRGASSASLRGCDPLPELRPSPMRRDASSGRRAAALARHGRARRAGDAAAADRDLDLVGDQAGRLLRRGPLPGHVAALRGADPAAVGGSVAGGPAALAPTVLALCGIFGLAAWSALSATLEPLSRRRHRGRPARRRLRDRLRLRPLAVQPARPDGCTWRSPRLRSPGAIAGLVTLLTLSFGNDVRLLPRGRRHAAVPARLSQRQRRLLRDRRLAGAGAGSDGRAAVVVAGGRPSGAATLCIELALLSQSRGFLLGRGARRSSPTSSSRPRRTRALVWLALATIPALGRLAGARRHLRRRERRRASTAP